MYTYYEIDLCFSLYSQIWQHTILTLGFPLWGLPMNKDYILFTWIKYPRNGYCLLQRYTLSLISRFKDPLRGIHLREAPYISNVLFSPSWAISPYPVRRLEGNFVKPNMTFYIIIISVTYLLLDIIRPRKVPHWRYGPSLNRIKSWGSIVVTIACPRCRLSCHFNRRFRNTNFSKNDPNMKFRV